MSKWFENTTFILSLSFCFHYIYIYLIYVFLLIRFSEGKIFLLDWGMSAGVNNFFCAQLLHFSSYFDQTYTEGLSTSVMAHMVGVLRFEQFWRNYDPLWFFKYSKITLIFYATPPTFLKWFWTDFHRSFVIMCPGAYCQCFAIQIYFFSNCYSSIFYMLQNQRNAHKNFSVAKCLQYAPGHLMTLCSSLKH